MTATQKPTPAMKPNDLSELFARYLQNQTIAQSQGLGFAESTDEMSPFEATPVQPIDPALAWNEAQGVLGYFPAAKEGSLSEDVVPEDWSTLVAGIEPAVDLAFCLGNYPQLVRHFYLLLTGDPAALRRTTTSAPVGSALTRWAEALQTPGQRLLAAGILRLAGWVDEANTLLADTEVPEELQDVRANEEAALCWRRGEGEKALAMWRSQPDSVPVLFNRGMACLFLGKPEEAREPLKQTLAALPDTSAWHHLAGLYLAMAQR